MHGTQIQGKQASFRGNPNYAECGCLIPECWDPCLYGPPKLPILSTHIPNIAYSSQNVMGNHLGVYTTGVKAFAIHRGKRLGSQVFGLFCRLPAMSA